MRDVEGLDEGAVNGSDRRGENEYTAGLSSNIGRNLVRKDIS